MYKMKSPSSGDRNGWQHATLGISNSINSESINPQANQAENEMPTLIPDRAPDKSRGSLLFRNKVISILLHFFNSVVVIVCIFAPSRTLSTVPALRPSSRSRPSSEERTRERATQRCSVWVTSTKTVGEAVVPAMPATQEPTPDTCTISLLSQIAVSLAY
jgi:hypothetical protein